MPHRPVLLANRAQRISGLSQSRIKVKNRKEIKVGHRGHTKVWLPTGAHERIVTQTGKTAAIALTIARPSVVVPPTEAVGVVLILSVNANTNTAGQVLGMVARDRTAGTGRTDAAVAFSQEMGNNTWQGAGGGDAPLIDGGIYYQVAIAGTVNYDFFIDLVGWILE